MKKKSDKIQNKAPLPLTEVKLRKELKPKLPKKGTEKLSVGIDLMLAAENLPKVRKQIIDDLGTVAYKGGTKLSKKSDKIRSYRLRFEAKGLKLGTHIFPSPIEGKQLKLPKETKKTREMALMGLPNLDGYYPNHLALDTFPKKLHKSLVTSKFMTVKAKRRKKEITEITTLFSPEDRYTFSDTSFPWCTIGRVDTAGGFASGVLIGPRHLLTVSHTMVWNLDGSAGWVRYRPSFFDGSAPFGEAWGIRYYVYRKVTGPSLSRAESREDYVVIVLDRDIGNTCGWMGSRTYSDSWDSVGYWRHIGYPGDLAGGQRPSYERDIALDGDGADSNSHKRAYHLGDVWPGQSGGPFFAWWSGESWPRVVAVQSGQTSSNNLAAAGSRLVNLIISARNDFP